MSDERGRADFLAFLETPTSAQNGQPIANGIVYRLTVEGSTGVVIRESAKGVLMGRMAAAPELVVLRLVDSCSHELIVYTGSDLNPALQRVRPVLGTEVAGRRRVTRGAC